MAITIRVQIITVCPTKHTDKDQCPPKQYMKETCVQSMTSIMLFYIWHHYVTIHRAQDHSI